jgi:hypothetical protein
MKLRYPLALLLVVLISCVSEQDYQDALHEEGNLHQSVCDGVHGDYLNLRPCLLTSHTFSLS